MTVARIIAAFGQANSGYFVMATVTNVQDTLVRVWIMACSWPTDNWITNNNSVYLSGTECARSFQTKTIFQDSKAAIYWSNEVTLKDNLYRYQIDSIPYHKFRSKSSF